MLSGRCLWVGLITLPEESYRLWCVVLCDLETSRIRKPWPAGGLLHQRGGGNLKFWNLVLFVNKRLKIFVERQRYHLLVLCGVLLVLKLKMALRLYELVCIFKKFL